MLNHRMRFWKNLKKSKRQHKNIFKRTINLYCIDLLMTNETEWTWIILNDKLFRPFNFYYFYLEWLKQFWYLIIRENPEWRNSINAILKQSNNQWLRSVYQIQGFGETFMVFAHSILIMILGNIFTGFKTGRRRL